MYLNRDRYLSRQNDRQALGKTLVGLLLFVGVGYAFIRAPVRYVSDSRYSLLMDEAILESGSPDMMIYRVPHYLWTVRMVNGRLLYIYPWGGPLLSLPAVGAFSVLGLKVAPHRIYSEDHELRIQMYLTTVLCAATVWLFYDMAGAALPLGWSVMVALGAAFGTQLLSTASRNLWPQTWYLFLMSAAVWLLMKARPVVLGTTLAWACFSRPQELPVILMVVVYVFAEYGWRHGVATTATVAVWSALFAVPMFSFFGHWLPAVYGGKLGFPHDFALRIAAVLVSPSRGLLVFVPIVLLPIYLILRYRRELPRRSLVLLSLAAIAFQLTMTACWDGWWGGGSYGPRLLMDTIPWFVVMAVLGITALVHDRELTAPRRAAAITAALLLLTVSVAMNAVGALSVSANNWSLNYRIDSNPQGVWDWKHPQFLAWAQDG